MNSGTDPSILQVKAEYAQRFNAAYRDAFGVDYSAPSQDKPLPPEPAKEYFNSMKVKLPSGKKCYFGIINGVRLKRPLATRTKANRYAQAVSHRCKCFTVGTMLIKPVVEL